jgi:ribonucleoside-triphosphate reductase
MSANNVEKETLSPIQTVLRVPCEVYSRIVGYLRPVQAWNKGKQQEFRERKTFCAAEPDRRE